MSLVIKLHKFKRGRKSSSTRNCKPHVSVITQLYRLLWIKNSQKIPQYYNYKFCLDNSNIPFQYIKDFKTCLILQFFTDISKAYYSNFFIILKFPFILFKYTNAYISLTHNTIERYFLIILAQLFKVLQILFR